MGHVPEATKISGNTPDPWSLSQLPKLIPEFLAVVLVFCVSCKNIPLPNRICTDLRIKECTPAH